MPKELSKTYEPKSVEPKIYSMWESGNHFHAVVDKKKKPFSIVIPPPNVTGQLHLGHAFDNTLQDIATRFKRMQGYSACWVPGTDHAGIATQIKVEEMLRKEEGITRHDLGREKFLERVWDWKNKYGNRIIQQLKVLGSSCDWERERFTMDEGCSRAVRETFVKLYNKGLIYKGSRIIHWCPSCTTALSDAEVEYEEKEGKLWHIKYPLSDGSGFLTVATTRPETMLGDTAVAVNPDDERYKEYIGKTLTLPLMNREIPIVADDYVEKEFGTGCVKITPSHDPNDFELASRHNLPHILVLDEKARINENGGRYKGLTREEARKAVLADLELQGLLQYTTPHPHNVGICYRCSTIVEPIDSAQWFVKMKPLAEPAMEVVKDGRMTFVPDRFTKIYMNWMENVRDWCISRQLWWGHRIPAWYCSCGHVTVSMEDATQCAKCGSTDIKQDEDVLDTWFSSALWPFSVFGWPDMTEDLKYFYPTSVVTPGYEIIFFWVARMIFSGLEHMGDVPFRTALMHGIVRDDQGRKMSKSLGNGIDPIDVIDTYGADALRLAMISGVSPGNDMRFRAERCEGMRNFCNKIWNASRFVLMNSHSETWGLPESLDLPDMWILTKLNRLIPDVTENMEKYEYGIASQKIYDFLWSDFCDWYIELTKARLQGTDTEAKETAEQVLSYVLTTALKLLHPFMPFITEEIFQNMPDVKEGEVLMKQEWPLEEKRLIFDEEATAMESVMDVIRSVRSRRAEMNVPPSKKAKLFIVSEKEEIYTRGDAFLKKLAYASDIEVSKVSPENSSTMVQCVTDSATVFMPLAELVDLGAEKIKLEKELANAEKDAAILETKLANSAFVDKAPANVVAAEREKLVKLGQLIEKLKGSIASI